MNKKLIAIAIAGAMAAPFAANAEVTITGQVQQEIVNYSGDSPIANGLYVEDGGQYGNADAGGATEFAVAASQDLGGGLKAIAKLATDFNVDEGGAVVSRDAYAGLAGGFGTVLVGHMSTPYTASSAGWDPFIATFAQARGNGGMSTLHNGYGSNVVAYANTFGTVKVVAAVGIDETPEMAATGEVDDEGAAIMAPTGDTVANHSTHLSVNVPVGPVELALGYLDSGADEDSTAIKAAVRWTGGPIGAVVQYETVEANVGQGAQAGDHIYANVTYAMGATTFALGYGQFSGDTDEIADVDYLVVGLKHNFSKAVTAHVAYRSTSPDTAVDADETAIGAGIRVRF